MPEPGQSLLGRDAPAFDVPETHFVHGQRIQPPFPEGCREVVVGMGCFWGAERILWQTPGVVSTAVGYAAGTTPHPTYKEVCSGRTGHNEVVRVIYDPEQITLEGVLKVFWENHDPTQGMRQGNDVGTQYRSGIYLADADERARAKTTLAAYLAALTAAGKGSVTTEICAMPTFYYAEDYHQQYLAKNPNGYCAHGFNGVSCPIGTGA
jgi:peptide-methionine (S)-S-oxide reductase